MKATIKKTSPSLGESDYFSIELEVAGIPCVFRMSDRSYSRLADRLTGDNETHDDPRIKTALLHALDLGENQT